MNTLRPNNYAQISYDKKHQLIQYDHPVQTFNTTPTEYLRELKALIKCSQQYKSQKGLGDLRDFQFIVTSNQQEWIHEHLYPITQQTSFQKHAVLLSAEFMKQLSLKQARNRHSKRGGETRYFANEWEAKQWLLA